MSGIELAGIGKSYAGVAAVDDVSLAVAEGEFLTILGPSGSGKSTLLNLIAGLTAPTRGRIGIGGRDVTELPPAARNVGLVFQSYALFPNMNVAANVAFPLDVRGLDRGEIDRRVAEVLRLVRLVGLETRRPGELSGGQQQRVALARAIVFRPDILLLDEPLAALDRKLREEVRVELRRLQRKLGITTVLVTHDQEEALSLSDRVVVLESGRVRQIDAPADAYQRPRSRFVAEFLGLANLFEGRLRRAGAGWTIATGDALSIAIESAAGSEGDEVLAIVRPERVALGAPRPDAINGTVTDAVFLGQSVRYHVALANGREMVAIEADGALRHRPGASVALDWKAADVWMIAEGN